MNSTALSNVHTSWDERSSGFNSGEQAPTAEASEQDIAFAKSLVPLSSIGENHLRELLKNNDPEIAFSGQCLFEAGSYDRQFIYLLHGEVELQYADGSNITVVGSEQIKAIAHQQPRPCRAVAKSDCSILRVDAELLDKMLTWSQVAEYLLLDISYQRDLDEDAEWMMTILRSNLFFKVPPTNASIIFDRMKSMKVEAGQAILRQGEIGDKCYFIKEGEAEVLQSPDGVHPPTWVADIGPGRCFGEDALVNETVRNASVIMKTDGELVYISKRDFLKLLKEPKVDLLEVQDLPKVVDSGAIFIDVRTEEEYAQGHIERAVNIPLNLLRIKLRLLDKRTSYVVYCDNGRRSKAAVHLLKKARFNVTTLNGGVRQLQNVGNLDLQVGIQDYVLRDGEAVIGN